MELTNINPPRITTEPFLWLFYGFSTSLSKKPSNLTLRLTSSCHPVLTKQLDVTLLKNKSDETTRPLIYLKFLNIKSSEQITHTTKYTQI